MGKTGSRAGAGPALNRILQGRIAAGPTAARAPGTRAVPVFPAMPALAHRRVEFRQLLADVEVHRHVGVG